MRANSSRPIATIISIFILLAGARLSNAAETTRDSEMKGTPPPPAWSLPDPTSAGPFGPWGGIPTDPLPGVAAEVKRGDDLYFGRGVARDDSAALDAYADAADDGSLYAMNRLGTFYALGIGTEPDPTYALAWYVFAADRGYVPAMINLSIAIGEGEGVTLNAFEAFGLAERLLQHVPDPHAMYLVGHASVTGAGTDTDMPQAIKLLTEASDQGVALASWDLGTLYALGRGVSQNSRLAAELIYQGLTHGVPNSLPGLMNSAPDGLPVDLVATLQGLLAEDGYFSGPTTSTLDDATKHAIRQAFNSRNVLGSEFEDEIATLPGFRLERAAQKAATGVPGDPTDISAVATVTDPPAANGPTATPTEPPADAASLRGQAFDFFNGANGQAQDYAKAAELFLLAAKQGDATSMLLLGLMAENGYGREKNAPDAVAWYRQSGDAGNSYGYSYLGDVYNAGVIVARDYREAAKWYRKAADQGNDAGMFSLGVLYAQGNGVALDREEAVAWWKKAVRLGNANANWTLSLSYLYGRGIDKDTYQAAELAYYALTRGVQFALDELNNIARATTSRNYRLHLQELLAADGYYSDAIDGSFGPRTQAAIGRAFGSKKGIR